MLPRLDRPEHLVARFFEMLTGMLTLRAVTAAELTANQAHSNMNPLVAVLSTLRADRRRSLHDANQVEMPAITLSWCALKYEPS